MWCHSTKQRKAAVRRRALSKWTPDERLAAAVAGFRRAMAESRPDVVRAVAENVWRNNALLRRLRGEA